MGVFERSKIWGALGLVWVRHTAGAVIFNLCGDTHACPFL